MKYLIEAILTVTTLGGYWMVTNGFLFLGAVVALVSNVLWTFYGINGKLISLVVINVFFAMININIIMN